MKTLNLFNKDGYYNIAGELLADRNDIAFSGIDIVKFGKYINKILYRETISHKSLLAQFDRAIEIFEQYYQYEEGKSTLFRTFAKQRFLKPAYYIGLAIPLG